MSSQESSTSKKPLVYTDAGVDIAAGSKAVELMKEGVKSTYGPEVLMGIGSFGGLFDIGDLCKKYEHPVLVASTDGVGTKTKVAVALGRYDTIGQDIVNHCVNDILVQGARPLFFLDYVATNKLDPERVAAIVNGCSYACRQVGCALLGGETAEMPGVYLKDDLDLVGTIVGVVDKKKIIDGTRMTVGDKIVALPSSGLHTNGFSLARLVLKDTDLTQPREELDGKTIGEALLVPHRQYLTEFDRLCAANIDIKGMAHITGGGLIDNPPRILPSNISIRIERSAWTVPPLFQMIQQIGSIADNEMAHVFNMGLGMLFFVPAADAAKCLEVLGSEAKIVGEVIARDADASAPRVLFS